MRSVLCLVTSSVPGGSAEERALVARVEAAARAGVHLIQVRQRHMETQPLLRLVRRCLEAVASSRTRVLVNDRVDVALAAGAHGAHLRGDSPSAARVRALVPPGFLLGRSVHTIGEATAAAAAGGLDYLTFGTVFPSPSKPGVAAAGARLLADVAASVPLPVLAIGGVTPARMGEVRRAGAAGVSAIGLFDSTMVEEMPGLVAALLADGTAPPPEGRARGRFDQ